MSTVEQQLVQLIAVADGAINREDFEALLGFYAADATLVVMPGREVRGHANLRNAFVAIADHFNHTLHVSQKDMKVVEGAGVALVIARTIVTATMKNGEHFHQDRKATYVFRREASGEWMCVVDNSYGTDLLST